MSSYSRGVRIHTSGVDVVWTILSSFAALLLCFLRLQQGSRRRTVLRHFLDSIITQSRYSELFC